MADEVVQMDEDELSPKTKKQLTKELHEKRNRERANAQNELKIVYKAVKDEPAFIDILTKARSWAAYHLQVAKDGVAMLPTGQVDDAGQAVMQTVNLAPDRRLAELDKAAGIQEIVDYLERQTKEELPRERVDSE